MTAPANSVAPIPRSMVAKKILAMLALVVGWLFLIPFLPDMPASGLDLSWRYALNVAVSQGLVFGRDVVFTFGPLASVYSQLYSPGTDHLMMAGSTVYGAAFCAVLGLAAYPRKLLVVIVVPFLIAFNILSDPFFITIPLLLLFNVARVYLPQDSLLYLKPSRIVIFALVLATVAVGMAPIIKGSFSGVVLPISGITALILARKSVPASIAFAVLMIASASTWWVISGQPLGELPRFFIAQSPIISGYTEAMSLNGSLTGPVLYTITSALMCGTLFYGFRNESRVLAWAVFISSAWTLFVAFKAGFVRHDGHAFIAVGVLLFVAYLVACVTSPSRAAVATAISVVVAAVAVHAVYPVDKRFPIEQVKKDISKTVDGLALRIEHPAELSRNYATAVAAIRSEDPLPRVSGTVDIYPTELTAIFANGLQWSGRPVFQSYSAYTPALLKMNDDHLASPRAPQNVFFMLGPIDNRLPAFDDSNSILTLLTRYNIVGYSSPYIQMERAASPNRTHLVESNAQNAVVGWDQDIPIRREGPMWLSIDIRQTMLGRLAETLFKLPQVEIDLTLGDGTVVRHRYIPDIGRSGFIASPYLATTTDLIDLAAGLSDAKDVKSFKLVTRFPIFWGNAITVRMTPIYIAIQPVARSVVITKPSEKPPSPLLHAEAATPTHCAIDVINDRAYHGGIVSGGKYHIVSVRGWTIPNATSNARDFNSWIVATLKSGQKLYFKASHQERPDVASAFNRTDVINSGFDVTLDTTMMSDQQTIAIFSASKDMVYRCDVQMQFSGTEL